MRLLIALVRSVIIIGVGVLAFGVKITGPFPLTIVFIALGAVTFLALGYVVASFASKEDAADGMTSVIQFPMMFLSGTFFPIDSMPDPIQAIARFSFAVLAGWLVVCLGIAARKFRWQ